MRRSGRAVALALAFALAGCATVPPPARSDAVPLAPWFDCLRERGETLIGAHRGGPAAGLPENAIETMAATHARNPSALLEIDVQRSADGVLFLLHDDRLDRTTTGTGPAATLTWAELSALRLKDIDGAVTRARIPRLADALAWARGAGAVVQLDVKRGLPFAEVAAVVRAAGASRNALFITYDVAQALEASRAAADLMVSVGIDRAEELAALDAAGVPRARMLAWTGIRRPDPALFAMLRGAGIEPMFGTLGRPGQRLDDQWLADGDPAEFAALARDGAVVIGTDRGAEVEPALKPVTCRR